MKLFFAAAFVLMFAFTGFAQSETGGVSEIFVARDDGQGRPGDRVDAFSISDIPIHCIVKLDSSKVATVKMTFVAVDVKGVKPQSKVFSVSYTTEGVEDQVNFTGRPKSSVWVAGKYRIDIYIDEKLIGSKAFPIGTPTIGPAAESNFVAPKPKPRPRKPKRQ